jgi:hypothetical protein
MPAVEHVAEAIDAEVVIAAAEIVTRPAKALVLNSLMAPKSELMMLLTTGCHGKFGMGARWVIWQSFVWGSMSFKKARVNLEGMQSLRGMVALTNPISILSRPRRSSISMW